MRGRSPHSEGFARRSEGSSRPRRSPHGRSSRERGPALAWRRVLDLALLPPELDLAPHLRPRRHRQTAGLQIADEGPRLLELDGGRGDDLPPHLAPDQHDLSVHLSVDRSARLDRQLTLDVDVTLEPARHTDVAVSLY